MASNDRCSTNWNPKSVLCGESHNGSGHACIVLNREIRIPPAVAQCVWQTAMLRCTVDGGTNRWRHFLNTHCQRLTMKQPDLITGDFDSITEETSNFFTDPITQRIHTPDQNDTDFTKAIAVVRPLMEAKQVNDAVVFHDNSGRFDQIMANINTVFKVQCRTLNLFLLSGNGLTWLLRPGKHSIHIPEELVAEQRWCALMPIGETASCVTTTGLKWNLTRSCMKFGDLVSTSNTYAATRVYVETSHCLVWSMGLFSFHDD